MSSLHQAGPLLADNSGGLVLAVLVLAAALVAFWRVLLRLLIIGVVAVAILGVLVIVGGAHDVLSGDGRPTPEGPPTSGPPR